MPGHDGLFARPLPIALSCFSPVDIHGFRRRRFDLFAIAWIVLQSWVKGSPLHRDYSVCGFWGSAPNPIRLVIGAISNHGPGHAGGLIGPGHRGHIGAASHL